MSSWESFNKLATLQLTYIDSDNKKAFIYGNGNNQVAVGVTVKVLDKDNKALVFEPAELAGLVYFCRNFDGNEIKTPFYISDEENDYSKAISYTNVYTDEEVAFLNSPAEREGELKIIKYISCDDQGVDLIFSVGINVPGVGKFDTTNEGTGTLNGPGGSSGSIFKSPNHLTVEAEIPVNYSFYSGIDFNDGWRGYSDLTKNATNVPIKRRLSGVFHWNSNGAVSYGFLQIKSQKGYKFLRKKVVRNEQIRVDDMMNIFGYKGTAPNGDEIFGEEGAADVIWGLGGENYDTSLIFADPQGCGIVHTKDDNNFDAEGIRMESRYSYWWYKIAKNDTRHYFRYDDASYPFPKISDNSVIIAIWNCRCPQSSLWKREWSDKPHDGRIQINVIDEYGNFGTISIVFGDEYWPRLKVNGTLV